MGWYTRLILEDRRQVKDDHCEFKAILVNTVNSSSPKAIHLVLVLQTKKSKVPCLWGRSPHQSHEHQNLLWICEETQT